MSAVIGLARSVLDLLLPPQCPTCDRQVDRQGALCPTCFSSLSFVTEPLCRCCGVPFPHAFGPNGECCPGCEIAPPPWRQARAALRYDAGAKTLVLPLKHSDRVEFAAVLAPHMARAGRGLLARADLLVPVPLHNARLRARRYNQSAMLARAVGRLTQRPVIVDALRRCRRTPPLGDLGQEAREAAVRGAFTTHPARRRLIAGRRVLLVDDVLTSGATARACTLALLAAGAAEVDVLVAARVPDPRLS